ncbi:MAG: hypothetical protein LBC39_01300 [Methanobrevibacter sp.]|jgi:hypothetical protein|nr:hypothetical protein [Candidatus Methanovirga aequatorialis]
MSLALKLKGIILIIFMMSTCTASSFGADNSSDLREVTLKEANNAVLNVFSSDQNDSDLLTYDDLIHFLEKGKNLPEYIIIESANHADLKTAKFRCSNNVPAGYSALDSGYDFSDDCWKNTILYIPKVSLPKFYIHNGYSYDLANVWKFTFNTANTQFFTVEPIEAEFPEFPYASKDVMNTAINKNPLDTSNTLLDWVDLCQSEMNEKITAIQEAAAKVHTQNLFIGIIRGDASKDNYWSPDTYGGYYDDVDDNTLKIMNWYSQGMKVPLMYARNDISGIMNNYEWVIYGLDVAATAVPSDLGLDKPLKYASLGVKFIKLTLGDCKLSLDDVYTNLDADTARISGEKDYRSLVEKGLVSPKPYTKSDIDNRNKDLKKQIKTLNDYKNYQINLVNDQNSRDKLMKTFDDAIDYYDTVINTYQKYGGSSEKIKMFKERRIKIIESKNKNKELFSKEDVCKSILGDWVAYNEKMQGFLKGRLL